MRSRRARTLAMALACASLAAVGLGGCRGDRSTKAPRQFFPDLDDAPKWKPQTASPFFADGRAMRPRVAGTVAHGPSSLASEFGQPNFVTVARADVLREDVAFYQGKRDAENFVEKIPFAFDAAFVARGQERYTITCSVCHGHLGDGQGEVGKRFALTLPTFHDEKYMDPAQRTGKDGYLFSVIRNGVPKVDGSLSMPSYAHAMSERDSWAIVAYLRALQRTRRGTMEDVPAAERDALERTRVKTGGTP